MDDLEYSYQKFCGCYIVDDVQQSYLYLESAISQIGEKKISLLKEIRTLNRSLIKQRLFHFLKDFSFSDIYYSKEEISILNSQLDATMLFLDVQNQLLTLLDQNNYLELFHLGEFLQAKFLSSMNYFVEQLYANYYSSKGFGYCENVFLEPVDLDNISLFVQNHVNQFKKNKTFIKININ